MQIAQRRNTVCIDTRRTVSMLAMARKPADVAKEGHEQFIRNTLKDKLGWPRKEPAPQALKDAARQMASYLTQRDRTLADKKAAARAEQAAKDATVVQGIADTI